MLAVRSFTGTLSKNFFFGLAMPVVCNYSNEKPEIGLQKRRSFYEHHERFFGTFYNKNGNFRCKKALFTCIFLHFFARFEQNCGGKASVLIIFFPSNLQLVYGLFGERAKKLLKDRIKPTSAGFLFKITIFRKAK